MCIRRTALFATISAILLCAPTRPACGMFDFYNRQMRNLRRYLRLFERGVKVRFYRMMMHGCLSPRDGVGLAESDRIDFPIDRETHTYESYWLERLVSLSGMTEDFAVSEYCSFFQSPVLRSGPAPAYEFHSSSACCGSRIFPEPLLSERSVLVAAGFLRKASSKSNSDLFSAKEVLQRGKASASRPDA